MLSFQFKHVKESKHLSWCAVPSAQLLAAGSSLPGVLLCVWLDAGGPALNSFPLYFSFSENTFLTEVE